MTVEGQINDNIVICFPNCFLFISKKRIFELNQEYPVRPEINAYKKREKNCKQKL